jgi:hypothetical protein
VCFDKKQVSLGMEYYDENKYPFSSELESASLKKPKKHEVSFMEYSEISSL